MDEIGEGWRNMVGGADRNWRHWNLTEEEIMDEQVFVRKFVGTLVQVIFMWVFGAYDIMVQSVIVGICELIYCMILILFFNLSRSC